MATRESSVVVILALGTIGKLLPLLFLVRQLDAHKLTLHSSLRLQYGKAGSCS